MPHAIVMQEPGDTAVLHYAPVTIPQPTGTQVHVRHQAIGVNFIDTYFRTGLYKWPQTPLTPGAEAAGEVVAVGEAVFCAVASAAWAQAGRPQAIPVSAAT